MDQANGDDLLQLRICPGCDYSLETLPSEGICPECGRRYDKRWLVLTGNGRGSFDTSAGGTWRGWVIAVIAAAFLMWAGMDLRRFRQAPVIVVLALFIVITAGTQLFVALFSARLPLMQLWLSPKGFVQVPSSPEAQRVCWVVGTIYQALVPPCLIAVLASDLPKQYALPLVAAVALITCTSAIRSWRRTQARQEIADGVPPLIPWDLVTNARISPGRSGYVRIRVKAMRHWGSIKVARDNVGDIEVALTAEEAQALRRRLSAWTKLAEE